MKDFLKALLAVYAAFVAVDLIIMILMTIGLYIYGNEVDLSTLPRVLEMVFITRPFGALPELLGISYLIDRLYQRKLA